MKKKYIAITPLENPPLTMTWANYLVNMDSVFFISELGKQEAIKAGITKAQHIVIGEDCEAWHPAAPEEKKTLRKGLGIGEDDFVVLTVADNQERKNLWAGCSAVALLKKEIDRPIKYILVTRKDSPFGWKFPDLPLSLGIIKEVHVYERGLPQKDLWGLYAVADVYLQPSKAEGLGLPVMDAMACGIPVVATDTGALHELLEDGRGYLVESDYEIGADVWGNEKRSLISIKKCKDAIKRIASSSEDTGKDDALTYVRSRSWDIPVNQLDEEIKNVTK